VPEADFSRIPAREEEETETDSLELMDFPEAEEAPARRREGLPPAYRMRHPRHYVEQLMGDAPIQTVKQIAIGDVHGHAAADRDLSALADSIRQFGILQPLIVTRAGSGEGFRVIAGGNRLDAARLAGLPTVPCLVIETDAEQFDGLRQQASRRAVRAAPAAPAPAPAPHAGAEDSAPMLRVAFREISSLLACLTTLVPLATDEEHGGFRGSILRDLMMVEADRATTIASAAALLTRAAADEAGDEPLDCRDVLLRISEKVGVAARLKGVHLEWPSELPSAQLRGHFHSLVTAWSGLMYVCLAEARPGDRLVVNFEITRVRPAVIFQVTLHRQPDSFPSGSAPDQADGGFERESRSAAVLIGAAERCARQHGGRFGQEQQDDRLGAVFVIPVPVD
jgi:hypothetical protein